jgi:hypothetical protein
VPADVWSDVARAPIASSIEEEPMSARQYRLTLIVCATSWLMLGLHLPAVHQMTHHGRSLPPIVLLLIVLFALIGIAGLWALWRSPWSGPATPSER